MSRMAVAVRPLVLLCAGLLVASGGARVVDGAAVAPFGTEPNLSGVDVDRVLLDQGPHARDHRHRRAPRHDHPVDGRQVLLGRRRHQIAQTAPPQCRFVFEDTATFGPDIEEFHKTTFQYPPRGGLISEAAAAYRDATTARRAFDALVATVRDCANTSAGAAFVSPWTSDDRSLQTRPGDCGRTLAS